MLHPPPDRDKADVDRVLAGELNAFSGIVERWQKPLVNLAFRFCRHEGVAEELAQEAFVRAFRSLHQWRGGAAFSTWLFALSLNVFRSHLRRTRPADVALDDALHSATSDPSPESRAVAAEQRDLVRRAVSALPSKYRDALVLYYFLEQDVAAAASCLGIPEGSAKARLHRGRELLKDRLTRMTKRGLAV